MLLALYKRIENIQVWNQQMNRFGVRALLGLHVNIDWCPSFQRFKASSSLLSIKSLVVYLAFTVFFFLTYYLCLLKSVYYLFNIKPAANSVRSKTKWEITRLPHHRYMDLYSNGWLLFNCSTAGNHLFCQMCYPMSPRAGNVHHRDSSFEKVIVWTTFHTF